MEQVGNVGLGRRALRLAGQGLCALLLLLGLHVVGTSIDVIPYVGTPQIDYYPMNFDRPFWPQLVARYLPSLLTGLLVSVLSLAGLQGRFQRRSAGSAPLKGWIMWAVAMLALRLAWGAVWGWPSGLAEAGWMLRYAAINAAVSATLLTTILWSLGRYADWSARPRTGWGEAALWFAVSAVLLCGFNIAMMLLDGLSLKRLMSDTWQMILLFGGLLAVAVTLTPRPTTPSRPGGRLLTHELQRVRGVKPS